MTKWGGQDRRERAAAGGEPRTDPSTERDPDLTEDTDAIYAQRRPRWRWDVTKRSPEGRRRRATAAARLGLTSYGDAEGEREKGEVRLDRELTLSA